MRDSANRAVLSILLLCSAGLAGCSVLRSAVDTVETWIGLEPPRAALRHLTLVTDHDANDSSAVRIDIVAVHDKAAALALPKSSSAWFEQRQALKGSLADAIAVQSFEVPAGRLLKHVHLPHDVSRAWSVRAYVDLRGQSEQGAIDITNPCSVTLHVQRDLVTKIVEP
ncbi:hypothetical protein [Hylemonella gracilis]|uniref:Lipoprotein n=1 Tax=Hylemonella gracilis ATCC 19624 TaxID=887062 RepID=F3KSJ3_9BURK|nr:hypothetical protein [Hylemonella gracilis]EGI77270.1 hypothetical protein HGR_07111 [Hylemonella gracilis ATCC 19624]